MSRLLDNSIEYRKRLESRNLYTPTDEYDLKSSKMTNSISSLMPFINVTGVSKILSPMERLYDRLFNRTPIIEIGMRKLADQFLKTVASNTSRSIAEVVDLGSIIKNKNLSGVYTGLNYKITKIKGETFLDNAKNIVEELVGTSPILKLKLGVGTRDKDLIDNTGTGQLHELSSNVNKNRYIYSSIKNNKFLNENKYINRGVNKDVIGNSFIFESDDDFFNNSDLVDLSNHKYQEDLKGISFSVYNPSNKDLLENSTDNRVSFLNSFGNTMKNKYIKSSTKYGFRDDSGDLTWGYNESSYENIKQGLLYYTQMLNIATDGKIDLTRKIYKDKNGDIFSYNGSGVYEVPEESYAYNDKLYDGIRQHVIFGKDEGEAKSSKYDNYAKLIRFNGNIKYDGNVNSVIYNTVIPKIAPNFESGDTARNKMFSIENLALRVVKKDVEKNVCYLEDDTILPLSENGYNGGRVMWFPPYDVKLSEDATPNFTPISFIGRGEELYTYNNTKRSGRLSFKLIIDYPPQLRGIKRDSNFNDRVNQFFAFGGFKNGGHRNLIDIENDINIVNDEINNIKSEVVIVTDDKFSIRNVEVYFPNDSYDFPTTYERDKDKKNDDGLNVENGAIEDNIDEIIKNYLIEENATYLDINLTGYSSKLYLANGADKYNMKLSTNRCNSVAEYIRKAYNTIHGGNIDNKFTINITSKGSTLAIEENDPSKINTLSAKKDRYVNINVVRNSKSKTKTLDLSDEDKKRKEELLKLKGELERELEEAKNYYMTIDYNRFNEITIKDNSKNTFHSGREAIENNIFQNVYYSQTPESFHRRLTFLQQCTRQGRNIDTTNKNNSVFGRPPICVLRYGDFIHSKIVITSISFNYSNDNIWDLNPEGMGVQPMLADIDISFTFIGGQSMESPLSKIQNASTFNYYANSTFYGDGTYATPKNEEIEEKKYRQK